MFDRFFYFWEKLKIMIRVTKQFNFEAAHALWDYNGKCKNIHGHTYKLFVTVKGNTIKDQNSPKVGMVMDFGDLKQIIKTNIVDIYDHALILNKKAKFLKVGFENQMYERFIETNYQPTCENMVKDFSEIIIKNLPKEIILHSVKLFETETSFAEWFAEDQ